MKINIRLISILLLLCFQSCTKEESIEIVANDLHLITDKVTTIMVHDVYAPPVASRIYAYPAIASYEVLHQAQQKQASLVGQLNGLESLEGIPSSSPKNVNMAALIAYMDVAKELVFSKEMLTNYRDSLYHIWKSKNNASFIEAEMYGKAVAKNIIRWMNTDQYAETRNYPEYNINTDDPSKWVPTPPAFMEGIEPHWNKIRTFVLDSAAQFQPIPPPTFSLDPKSKFFKELKEVYTIDQEIRKEGDTDERIKIAQFWDCNPYVSVNRGHFMFSLKKISPGAHWMGICKIASKQTNANFEQTVIAYTKTSIALFDAFISCWDEKYRSNLVRPETLINSYIDEDWKPILQTPPFPEYTSGHSVASGAAAEMLTQLFGEKFYFEDTTEEVYGLPKRAYPSFRAAAEEAAISRMYGGIHYSAAVKEGLTQGKQVGKWIVTKLR